MAKTQTASAATQQPQTISAPPEKQGELATLPENQGKVAKGSNPIAELAYGLDTMTAQLKQVLPEHIRVDHFKRVVMTAAYRDPTLLSADRKTLFNECVKCASDGLVPDGREAALVIFNKKVKVIDDKTGQEREQWIKAVQYMPMVFGILKRLRQSAEVSSISARVVYQKEVDEGRFEFIIRDGQEQLRHEPILLGDRGAPILVYATCRFKDGTVQNEPLTKGDIEKIKKVSKGATKGPWVDWEEEMWRKSAIRRLSKYLPLSASDLRLVHRDDEAETEFDVAKREAIATAQPQSLDAARMLGGPAEPEHDADTGEVIEQPQTETEPTLLDGEYTPGAEG
jgi:recombination protein RecT